MSARLSETHREWLKALFELAGPAGHAPNDELAPFRRRLAAWLDCWQEWSGQPLPSVWQAVEAFRATLSDSDLTPEQVETFVKRIIHPPTSEFLPWIAATGKRFVEFIEGWFPIWKAYVAWVLDWSAARNYKQVAFLACDSIPLYAVAKHLVALEERPLVLRLLYASRRFARTPALAKHLRHEIDPSIRLALVDSGCYGTVVHRVVDHWQSLSGLGLPAVFFYFSRNPRIFGYMNYLMADEMLRVNAIGFNDRSCLDFIIYAGDVLEAMPKPFRLTNLRDDGVPQLAVEDVVSFILSATLLTALLEFASFNPRQGAIHAKEAALRLYSALRGVSQTSGQFAPLLFDAPVPKSQLPSDDDGYVPGFPPQDEFFGVIAG